MAESLTPWYQFDRDEVASKIETDFEKGLSSEEAARRLNTHGKNRFSKGKDITIWHRIYAQLKNPLVLILLVAGGATLFLHEYADAIVIFIALVINIGIGVAQERRASQAFERLSESQEKHASVVRNGQRRRIPAQHLVPGDIIILEEGTYVPADARILEEKELTINESALTGEWESVTKDAAAITEEVPITEQANMAWMGTSVTAGDARAVVVGTGDDTQIGSIAQSLAATEERATPLQKSIQQLAQFLVYVILAIIAVIFLLGLFHGHTLVEMMLLAIAVAVAAMPQGLPAAVTVVLALGMEHILKQQGLVRNLLAAETLGSTTTILTDKTGTLTKAEMRVAQVITLQSLQRNTEHDLPIQEERLHEASKDEAAVLKMAMLNSSAYVEGKDEALAEWIVRGQPVERAVTLAGLESGARKEDLPYVGENLDSLPFSSERRFAASLHELKRGKKQRLFITGAPELLLSHATSIYQDGKQKRLTKANREELERMQEETSAQGMRLIAVGYKDITQDKIPPEVKAPETAEDQLDALVFCGFIVLHDPLREDVRDSIRTAHEAGTQIIMITGDNAATALTIAQKAGIATDTSEVLTGPEIDDLADEELIETLKRTRVVARVLPRQKLRIAKLFQDREEVVAMTGDGVNDAPALRHADIGIALGSGTEVAKEASDIILLDNSFSVIIHAIEEGRRILDNLKKIVAYLLSTSFAEIFLVGASLIVGTPLPLLPTQILWTNIIEEGFMNFAFAFEPKEKGVMQRDPRDVAMKRILTTDIKYLIFLIATVTGIFLIALYFVLLSMEVPEKEMRTIMFIAVSIDSIFFALSIKNLRQPIWRINLFSNRYLTFSLLGSFAALIIALVTPPLQTLLSLAPPSVTMFAILFGLGIVNLIIIEIVKYFTSEQTPIRKKAAPEEKNEPQADIPEHDATTLP